MDLNALNEDTFLTADLNSLLTIIGQADGEEVERIRIFLFGKSGVLTRSLRALGGMVPEERKREALKLNTWKEELNRAIAQRKKVLEDQAWSTQLQQEFLDVTLPSPSGGLGRFHPLMKAYEEIVDIFLSMGFFVRRGPDVETEFYNFDALNVHQDHPARAQQDTFYLPKGYLLRTQTSSVQVRTLLREKPPLRILSPGRVYRRDHDRTHTPMFHQIEGLVVEPNIHMGHLKGCMESFLLRFFGPTTTFRFRPSYFPFTEPSAEVDVAFHGTEDWLEMGGCGMVHPHVFAHCSVEDHAQGFAFGMGIERLAMVKYGIDDIRNFYHNDQRWLDHYGFSSTEAL